MHLFLFHRLTVSVVGSMITMGQEMAALVLAVETKIFSVEEYIGAMFTLVTTAIIDITSY